MVISLLGSTSPRLRPRGTLEREISLRHRNANDEGAHAVAHPCGPTSDEGDGGGPWEGPTHHGNWRPFEAARGGNRVVTRTCVDRADPLFSRLALGLRCTARP